MAPHRLTRPSLKDRTDGRQGWRWAIIRHTPTVFIEYLLEVALAVTSALVLIGYASGFVSNTAAIQLIPPWVRHLYLITLGVGCLTVLWGFIREAWGTWLATGVRMLALAYFIYAAAVAGELGFARAWQPILTSILIGLIAIWRAFLLRSTFELEYEIVKRRTDSEVT